MKKRTTKKNATAHQNRRMRNLQMPTVVDVPLSAIRTWMKGTLQMLLERRRASEPLDRQAIKLLLVDVIKYLKAAAAKDTNANQIKWTLAPRFLNLKVEVGHGGVLKAMDALNLLFNGALPLRTVNRRSQMVRGFITSQLGEPVTIAILRRDPDMLNQFDFKKFFRALKECGSEKAFLEKYCGVATQQKAGDQKAATAADVDSHSFGKAIDNLIGIVPKLSKDEVSAAQIKAKELHAALRSHMAQINGLRESSNDSRNGRNGKTAFTLPASPGGQARADETTTPNQGEDH